MILRYFLTLCALIGFASASAQSALNLPVKVLNGDSYYYYQVKKNAQITDISKVLGITAETITKYNPSAKDGVVKTSDNKLTAWTSFSDLLDSRTRRQIWEELDVQGKNRTVGKEEAT